MVSGFNHIDLGQFVPSGDSMVGIIDDETGKKLDLMVTNGKPLCATTKLGESSFTILMMSITSPNLEEATFAANVAGTTFSLARGDDNRWTFIVGEGG